MTALTPLRLLTALTPLRLLCQLWQPSDCCHSFDNPQTVLTALTTLRLLGQLWHPLDCCVSFDNPQTVVTVFKHNFDAPDCCDSLWYWTGLTLTLQTGDSFVRLVTAETQAVVTAVSPRLVRALTPETVVTAVTPSVVTADIHTGDSWRPDFVNYIFPLAKGYVCLWKTNILNNKKCIYLTSWVKIQPCFQRKTMQAVHSGWIFTHSSGSWTWEPTYWQMAARAVNNVLKPDPLKPLNLVQNLGWPVTLLDSW